MYGYFDVTTREIVEMRISSAPDCPEEVRKAIVGIGKMRASVLASLAEDLGTSGLGKGAGPAPEDYPVWTSTRDFVIGIGKPVGHFLPVLVFCRKDAEVTSETRAFLKFALAYIGKSLTEFVYARPVWPEGLAQATLKLLSIGYFVVNRMADVEIDGRDSGRDGARDGVRDGDFLSVTHGRLQTQGAKERAALHEAVRLAAGEERQTSVVSISDGRDQLKMVLVAPFDQGKEGRALVLYETGGTDHFALREHFFRAHAITRSEAQVAHEVLNGRSPSEASEATGLSLETVRSYLKQVFCKTGTHRQSELISLYYSWTLPVGKSIASAELRRRH